MTTVNEMYMKRPKNSFKVRITAVPTIAKLNGTYVLETNANFISREEGIYALIIEPIIIQASSNTASEKIEAFGRNSGIIVTRLDGVCMFKIDSDTHKLCIEISSSAEIKPYNPLPKGVVIKI